MSATKRLLTPGLAVVAALFLCTGPALAGDADQARSKVEKAQAMMAKVANKTDGWGLWKSTNKVLGNAEQSLKQGDYDAAIEAAEEVIFQAKKGLAQYREEQKEYSKAVGAASQSGKLKEDGWTQGDG
jgi:hypothetical protein